MVDGFWGKKIGMTQLFKGDKVVPVTVVNTADWLITQIKNQDKDGYNAIQVGCLRPKYSNKDFDISWLKNLKKHFVHVKEINLKEISQDFAVGKPANFVTLFNAGNIVDVFGNTKGCGFAGAVKRHGFRGGANSHGDKTGRRTGSLSFMRSQGRIIKGKRLPGHMGTNQVAMKNLEVIQIDPAANIIAIKGSLPGKAGSLVFISKHE